MHYAHQRRAVLLLNLLQARLVPGRAGFGGGDDVRRGAEAPCFAAGERESVQGTRLAAGPQPS